MGDLDSKILQSLLKPLKDKINEFVPKNNAKINNNISVTSGNNTSTISVEDSYTRIDSSNTKMDITNDGQLLINDRNIMIKPDSKELELSGKNTITTTTTTKTPDTTETRYNRVEKTVPESYDYTTKPPLSSSPDYIFCVTYITCRGKIYYIMNRCLYSYSTSTNTYTLIDSDVPLYSTQDTKYCCAVVGKYIYIFYYFATNNQNYILSYNISTGEYHDGRDLREPSFSYPIRRAVSVGTNIYLFAGNIFNYKYNTTADTYTPLKDLPFNFTGAAVAEGKNIYLFSTSSCYVFDTSLNTYTKIADLPRTQGTVESCDLDGDIYIFVSLYDVIYNYKYDTTTDTYTKNKNNPGTVYGATAVGDSIYMIGDNKYSEPTGWKYTPEHTKIVLEPYTVTIPGKTITTTKTYNAIFKQTNHAMYFGNVSASKVISYTSKEAKNIQIDDSYKYYTEYDENNNVIKNTFPINTDGTVRIYVIKGGVLNGKELTGSGWTTINILDYM